MKSTTGIQYLHIDYRQKYGHKYIVRVNIASKHLVVWAGNNKDIGIKIALKVQELMDKGKSVFLDWYDNDKEEWLDNLVNSERCRTIIDLKECEDRYLSCNCCFNKDQAAKVHELRFGRNNNSISIRMCNSCLNEFAERLWKYLEG